MHVNFDLTDGSRRQAPRWVIIAFTCSQIIQIHAVDRFLRDVELRTCCGFRRLKFDDTRHSYSGGLFVAAWGQSFVVTGRKLAPAVVVKIVTLQAMVVIKFCLLAWRSPDMFLSIIALTCNIIMTVERLVIVTLYVLKMFENERSWSADFSSD